MGDDTLSNDITKAYLQLVPIQKIAIIFNLPILQVKQMLLFSLGKAEYLRIAHRIGAHIVNQRLQDSDFRFEYSKRMSETVCATIHSKLHNRAYRTKWKEKATHGSRKGNAKIRELLALPSFRNSWSSKCSIGGLKVKNNNLGIFDPKNTHLRCRWSLLGLKNTSRKVTGPLGEKMYNTLEVEVAKILLAHNDKYVYEKVIHHPNINGFLSIDFFLPTKLCLLEVTCWDNLFDKASVLSTKFAYLRSTFPQFTLILITRSSMCGYYKRFLPDNVLVFDSEQLESFLAGTLIQA